MLLWKRVHWKRVLIVGVSLGAILWFGGEAGAAAILLILIVIITAIEVLRLIGGLRGMLEKRWTSGGR